MAVSLDHWESARHDASRRYPGAFAAALEAIATFKEVPGLHVSVSSVLSRETIRSGEVEKLLAFLDSLGVDEAWLSELKPSVEAFWSDELGHRRRGAQGAGPSPGRAQPGRAPLRVAA